MSHGSNEKCEPNFTPLLDLVLQLVMFFMLCANFVMAETDIDIKLPKAIAAKPLEAREDYVYYLNVNQEGKVVFPENAQPVDTLGNPIKFVDNPEQLKVILRRRAKEDKDAAGPGNEDKPLRTLIILRVHKECAFEKTYGVMKACRSVGYLRVQLRAILYGGPVDS